MLQGVGPSVALGRDTTLLREILDKTAEHMSQDLENQPEAEADLRTTIGQVYFALGQFGQAEMMHREALRLRIKVFGKENLLVAASLYDLSDALLRQDANPEKQTEAEALLREALTKQRKLHNESQDVARSLNDLAYLLMHEGKLAESESLIQQSLAMRRKLLGNGHSDVAWSLQGLCEVLLQEGRHAEAEPLAREALTIRKKLYGEEHPDVARSLYYLARTLEAQGKLAEAVPFYRESLAIRLKLLGSEHPDTAQALDSLGTALLDQGKLDEARSLYLEAADGTNTAAVTVQDNLGWRYQNGLGFEKDFSEALKWYRKAAEQGNSFGQMHLGWMYEMGLGVEKNYARAVELYRDSAKQGDPWGQMHLGWLYENGAGVEKDYAKAIGLFRESAKHGNPWGQTDLGQMYQNGWGVEKNYAEAVKMYLAAGASAEADLLNELARRLATSAAAEMRDGTNAVRFAEKAVSAADRKNAGFLDTLAAAYAETQQFDKAAAVEQEAINLTKSEQEKEDYDSRLKLYQAHQPYRAPGNP
jgi:TPR repeat protein